MDRIQDSDSIQAGETFLFKWRSQLHDLLENSIKNQKKNFTLDFITWELTA